MITVETAIAPSYWASYLINGDTSGLEAGEKEIADSWIKRMGWGMPVSCKDFGIARYHDAWKECPYNGDCQTYIFYKVTADVILQEVQGPYSPIPRIDEEDGPVIILYCEESSK